jgi:hypothetical protein
VYKSCSALRMRWHAFAAEARVAGWIISRAAVVDRVHVHACRWREVVRAPQEAVDQHHAKAGVNWGPCWFVDKPEISRAHCLGYDFSPQSAAAVT